MHFSIDRTVHTTAFDKPVVDHWLERKIAQSAAGSTEKDRSDDRLLQRSKGQRDVRCGQFHSIFTNKYNISVLFIFFCLSLDSASNKDYIDKHNMNSYFPVHFKIVNGTSWSRF